MCVTHLCVCLFIGLCEYGHSLPPRQPQRYVGYRAAKKKVFSVCCALKEKLANTFALQMVTVCLRLSFESIVKFARDDLRVALEKIK